MQKAEPRLRQAKRVAENRARTAPQAAIIVPSVSVGASVRLLPCFEGHN